MVTHRNREHATMSGRLDSGVPEAARGGQDVTEPMPAVTDPVRGRHRRGGSGAWTPEVPDRGPIAGRHAVPMSARQTAPLPLIRPARHAAEADPAAPPYPLREQRPGEQQARPRGRFRQRGELPAPREPGDARSPAGASHPDEPEDTDDLGVLTPLEEPVEDAEIDPLADTGSLGLGKFNLGTVPASVTPPVTWRRAAWFSVAAAASVLVALIALSTALTGPPRSTETIGLPGVLGKAPYPDGSDLNHPGTHRHSTSRGDDEGSTDEDTRRGGRERRGTGDRDTRGPGPGGSTGDRDTVPGGGAPGSTGSEPTIQPTAPPAVTVGPTRSNAPLRADQPVDGRRIAQRTISYYRLVTDDPQGAYALTDGSGSPEQISEEYSDVRDIRVREVYADPNSARTVNELTITTDDGRMRTEQRTLDFTHSDDPRIETDN